MENKIRVGIVAPVHNRRDLTQLCLRSLSRIDSTGLDIHIVIVDDGSTDGTAEAISEAFPDIEIIRGDGNLWFTEGTNVGVRAALKHDPKYVLLMNDDQVFDAEFLRSMVMTAERWPRSVIGPLLLLWDTPHKLFQVAPVWETFKGGWRHWSHQTVWTIPKKPWSVEGIVGNCVLVPAEAIRECGLMDSKRFPNFGDAEYTPRLKRHGWRLILDPGARVFCQPNNIPPPVLEKKPGRLFYDLFIDLKNVHSLRRRFYANLYGAPNKIKGLAAFLAFLLRLAARRNIESNCWLDSQNEPQIKDVFANAVLND